MQSDSSARVAYFYNYQIGKFQYGKEHPMKPKRIAMAHNLIVNLGFYRHLDVYLSREASKAELGKYHSAEYIEYLSQFVTSKKQSLSADFMLPNQYSAQLLAEFGLIEEQGQVEAPESYFGNTKDCPSFPGLYTFCQLSGGSSIDAARLVNDGKAEIVINYAGGYHHARKQEASGFCYVNDIVLCILELLTRFARVLYIDIDVHHGDGVEDAFYLTDRVLTLSFHQYGDGFFPESGHLYDCGVHTGRYYSINVPLKQGIDDTRYLNLFRLVVDRVVETYRPGAVVLQCGADSLSLD